MSENSSGGTFIEVGHFQLCKYRHGAPGDMARIFREFEGRKILCGGTTATIVSRIPGKSVKMSMKNLDPVIPPVSEMEGADLVTEKIITLGRVAEILEQ